MLLPDNPPGFHVYEVAPVAVIVPEDPTHKVAGLAETPTARLVPTLTPLTAVAVQPAAELPVTV